MIRTVHWSAAAVLAGLALTAAACSSNAKPAALGQSTTTGAVASTSSQSPTVSKGLTQPSPTESMTPCGQTGAVCPVASSTPAALAGWGTYRVTDPDRGTVYRITIRPGLASAAVQQVQAYRRLVDYVKPVNYVTMTIDNTHGTSTAWYSDLSIVSTAGKTYKLETISDEVDALREGLADESNDAEINAGNALQDADWSGNGTVLPGAKSSVLFIGGPDMPRPGRVFLDDNEAHR